MKCTFCNEEKECLTLDKCKLFFYQTVYVCKECSKRRGLDDFLSLKASKKTIRKSSKPICCPTCKTSLLEIMKSNELGCSDCFTTFKRDIIDMLWKKLPNIGYTGKNKKVETGEQNKDILIDKLQALMEEALEMEDYNAALYFSKEIKKIGKI